MADNVACLESLPNEIFIHILSPIPLRSLLPLSLVSQRFYHLITRIIHRRLVTTASLKDRQLILECFHPTAKLTTPALVCDYIGTDGISSSTPSPSGGDELPCKLGSLGHLMTMYSRFRPHVSEPRRTRQRRFRNERLVPHNQDASQTITLDPAELFSQLCTNTHVVKTIPNSDFILSCVTIGEGVIRVWRDWLADHKGLCGESHEWHGTRWRPSERSRMLWMGVGENVGLRVRVAEREDLSAPVIQDVGEDAMVSYDLEYEELVIRTVQLLLKVEDALAQEAGAARNSMVIGGFAIERVGI